MMSGPYLVLHVSVDDRLRQRTCNTATHPSVTHLNDPTQERTPRAAFTRALTKDAKQHTSVICSSVM